MAQGFHEFIKTDRARLNAERRATVGQQRDLEKKLADIDRELAAISAYETTKSGKAAQPQKPAARRGTTKRRVAGRRGSKREGIITALKGNPAGLSRGELLTEMGLKGNKAGEMSVSNALTALTKSKQVARQDGKYVVAAG